MNYQKMPSKGLYLTLTVLGFCLGIIWGALSIGPYRNMTAAIQAGDAALAEAFAKKIRTYFLIGLAVNVVFYLVGSRA